MLAKKEIKAMKLVLKLQYGQEYSVRTGMDKNYQLQDWRNNSSGEEAKCPTEKTRKT